MNLRNPSSQEFQNPLAFFYLSDFQEKLRQIADVLHHIGTYRGQNRLVGKTMNQQVPLCHFPFIMR